MKLRHQAISFVSAGSNTPVESDLDGPKLSEKATFVAVEHSDDNEEGEFEEEFDDTAIRTNIVTDTDMEIPEGAVARMSIQSSTERKMSERDNSSQDVDMIGVDTAGQYSKAASSDPPLFIVDTVGDSSLANKIKTRGKQPMRRDPSPARSDSSEEVVVFRGRKKPTVIEDPVEPQASRQSTTKPQQDVAIHGFRSAPKMPWPSTAPSPSPALGWASKAPKSDAEVDLNAKWAPAPAGSWWKKRKPTPDLDLSAAGKKTLDDAPPRQSRVKIAEPQVDEKNAEQTIQSLQADWKAVLKAKNQAKQTKPEVNEGEIKLDSLNSTNKRRGKRGRKKDNRQLRNPISSEDEDDDDEAAYDDYMANLAAQLDANENDAVDGHGFTAVNSALFAGIGGPSLVVDGKEIGEDEVLDESYMVGDDDSSSASSGPIGQDLGDISSDDEALYSDVNSSQLEETLEYTEREQWEDEEDLRQRRREAMTDEQIARMFAKQEELGIRGNDLVIESGDYAEVSEEHDGIGDLAEARAGLANITNLSFGRSANKHGMRRGGNRSNFSFPDASALADTVDQYGENGFDIMDFDRPSLRPTKRGRKGRLPPELEELSDEEMKVNMSNAWETDRNKKRLKKAEREELRQQGLLGATGKKGKADLSQKYQVGISRHQIHEELRAFLQNEGQTSLPFPPMDKNDRKALHEIANVMNLKSKSVGAGNNRFPVLYKTRLTVYDAETFEKLITLSSRGMLSRNTKSKFGRTFAKTTAKNAAKLSKAGPGGGAAAATVKSGEIVGAGAAEIGKENFGHRMMEKMGWSKGMALGREGEGILNPVEQVMRAGRAGLG